MSVTDHTDSDSTTGLSRYAALAWWQSIGVAALAATVVNLLVFLLASAGGASFEVLDQGTPHLVTAGGVAFFSVVPLVLGTGLAALLGLWWPGFARVGQVVGAGLALLSTLGPLSANTDVATRWSLAAMHVVAGIAVVAALEPIYRQLR